MAVTTHGMPRTLYRNRGANYKKNMWHKAISSVVDYHQVPYTLFSILLLRQRSMKCAAERGGRSTLFCTFARSKRI